MADTTIKLDSTVRDRLAVLAAERGTTMRELVEGLARATPTQEELTERHAAVLGHVRAHLCPELDDNDTESGEHFWRELEAGRMPSASVGAAPDRARTR